MKRVMNSDLTIQKAVDVFESALRLTDTENPRETARWAVMTTHDNAITTQVVYTETQFIQKVVQRLSDDLPLTEPELIDHLPSKFVPDQDDDSGTSVNDILDMLDDEEEDDEQTIDDLRPDDDETIPNVSPCPECQEEDDLTYYSGDTESFSHTPEATSCHEKSMHKHRFTQSA